VIYVHPFEDNFDDNFIVLSSYWPKTMEREKGREKKRTSYECEREKLYKSCHKIDVQISFLFIYLW
jgi:hypothetical protein